MSPQIAASLAAFGEGHHTRALGEAGLRASSGEQEPCPEVSQAPATAQVLPPNAKVYVLMSSPGGCTDPRLDIGGAAEAFDAHISKQILNLGPGDTHDVISPLMTARGGLSQRAKAEKGVQAYRQVIEGALDRAEDALDKKNPREVAQGLKQASAYTKHALEQGLIKAVPNTARQRLRSALGRLEAVNGAEGHSAGAVDDAGMRELRALVGR